MGQGRQETTRWSHQSPTSNKAAHRQHPAWAILATWAWRHTPYALLGICWRLRGWDWDVGQNDCTLFYCTKTNVRSLKQLDDGAVLPSYFKTVCKTVRGVEMVQLEGIADWVITWV
jgi:hypothetical protein